MRRLSIMMVAGEASGDLLAAELVSSLRVQLMSQAAAAPWDLEFFGAGGPRMKAAGVRILHDLTAKSVIGPTEVIANYAAFRRIFADLLHEALVKQPDVVILVDFSHFNQRLGEAIRKKFETLQFSSGSWRPLLVKYVSPQVWASRPGRARAVARTFDLLLCILPFERDWYAQRVPELETVYVGHWIMDRYPTIPSRVERTGRSPLVLLLPGSRSGEIRRHAPIMLESVKTLRGQIPHDAVMVLPTQDLAALVRSLCPELDGVEIAVGELADRLSKADLAIAATGSVTLECARFEVPTVAIYRTSWLTYQIAKRVVTVKYLAMPNLLAGEAIFPEFIQDAATPEALSKTAFDLLTDQSRRTIVKSKLRSIIASLGNGGASRQAAGNILRVYFERHTK